MEPGVVVGGKGDVGEVGRDLSGGIGGAIGEGWHGWIYGKACRRGSEIMFLSSRGMASFVPACSFWVDADSWMDDFPGALC